MKVGDELLIDMTKQAVKSETLLETATSVSVQDAHLLQDHRVNGVALMPGAVFIGAALKALRTFYPGQEHRLTDLRFEAPLLLEEEIEFRLKIAVTPSGAGSGEIGVFLATTGSSTCYFRCLYEAGAPDVLGQPWSVSVTDSCPTRPKSELYSHLRQAGNDYGPAFQMIERFCVSDGVVFGRLHTPQIESPLAAEVGLNPFAIDAAVHLMAANVLGRQRSAFLLAGVEMAWLKTGKTPQSVRIVGNASVDPEHGLAANIVLYDSQQEPVGLLLGVSLKWLGGEKVSSDPAHAIRLALAATFTAEPLANVMDFWSRELQFPLQSEFAPYNQVFQELLNPNSLLHANSSGANVILVRLEDWIGAQPRLSNSEWNIPQSLRIRRLPDGQEIAHLNDYETDYLYQEIFVDRAYLRHGISIQDGDCVFDVGANIGMFSLFARSAGDVTVFAFEPSPVVAPILKANAERAGRVQVFECGLSDRDGHAPFTFYAASSVFSTYHADAEGDETAVKAVIRNVVERAELVEAKDRAWAIEHFMSGRMKSEIVSRPLRTLSSIIEECGVQKIDLLKIDAEKSEWAVLMGLRQEHWRMVRQIVMEVHDRTGEIIDRIRDLLSQNGFEVIIETEDLLKGSGLHNVYAVRPGNRRPSAPSLTHREAILRKITDDFLSAIEGAAGAFQVPTIVLLCPASPEALKHPGFAASLLEEEKRIKAHGTRLAGVTVVDFEKVRSLYPVDEIHDPQANALGHIPYTSDFFVAMGTVIVRTVLALRHPAVKVVALDADDTLWTGICGEAGALGVQVDEGRKTFQEFLSSLADQGKLLALCSKNHEDDLLAVFRKNSQMQLREDHVTAWRVNWQPKSENLKSLAADLGLGLDSFVFFDDNPLECAEVSANAPEVCVLQVPAEAGELPEFVRHLWLLDQGVVTAEDKKRADFYTQDVLRKKLRAQAFSYKEFISSLELNCQIRQLSPEDLDRASQLTERTNQFNLAKRHYSANELAGLAASRNAECMVVRVSDRFGDYGLVGLLLIEWNAVAMRVSIFLLSCRALGRNVEHQMLATIADRAKSLGITRIEVPFASSDRNRPMQLFLDSLGRPVIPGTTTYLLEPRAISNMQAEAVETVVEDLKSSSVRASQSRRAADWKDKRRDPMIARRIATELSTVANIETAMSGTSSRFGFAGGEAAVAGLDPLRKRICEIWSAVLCRKNFGPDEDFFRAGGNSLALVAAISRLAREFKFVIPVEVAFGLRTVNDVGDWIERHKPEISTDASATPEPHLLPVGVPLAEGTTARLSYNQQALWYLYQTAPQGWAYNVPFGACTSRLDGRMMKKAFEQLCLRHALLRTHYSTRSGIPYATVTDGRHHNLCETDCEHWPQEKIDLFLKQECQKPFDLQNGPVVRLHLLHVSSTSSILLLVTHHILADLWSMEILVDDLLRLYSHYCNRAGSEDPPPAPTYFDFIEWQHNVLRGQRGEDLWDYWRSELNGPLPILGLQYRNTKTDNAGFTGDSHAFRLKDSLARQLREFAQKEGTTLYQILLVAYAVLLFRHTAQNDILIGSPFSVRPPESFSNVVGDFVNLVPIRVDLSSRPSFRDMIRRVGKKLAHAIAHQEFPFPLMVKKLRIKPAPGRMPLVQTTFALHEPQRLPGLGLFFLQGNTSGSLRAHHLELTPVGLTQQEGQFDLALEMVAKENTLWAALKYNRKLFEVNDVVKLAQHFTLVLAAAVANPDLPVETLTFSGE